MGTFELALLVLVVVFLFGARRIPELGRSLGTGLREFRRSVTLAKEPLELVRGASETESEPGSGGSVTSASTES